MCDITKEKDISGLQWRFVNLRKIDARRQVAGNRVFRFVTSRDAEEPSAVLAEAGRLILQRPRYVRLFDQRPAVVVGVAAGILAVQ